MSNKPNMPTAHTLKPSLKAFPLLWVWLIMVCVIIANQTNMFAQCILFLFCVLPVWLIMLFATQGCSYRYQNNTITKLNHITGQRLTIKLDDVTHVTTQPLFFGGLLGCSHVIFTLKNGRKFKIKNIKLPNERK